MKKTINFKGLVAMVTAVLTVFFAVVGCDNDDDEKSVVSDNYKAFQVIHKNFMKIICGQNRAKFQTQKHLPKNTIQSLVHQLTWWNRLLSARTKVLG